MDERRPDTESVSVHRDVDILHFCATLRQHRGSVDISFGILMPEALADHPDAQAGQILPDIRAKIVNLHSGLARIQSISTRGNLKERRVVADVCGNWASVINGRLQ